MTLALETTPLLGCDLAANLEKETSSHSITEVDNESKLKKVLVV